MLSLEERLLYIVVLLVVVVGIIWVNCLLRNVSCEGVRVSGSVSCECVRCKNIDVKYVGVIGVLLVIIGVWWNFN